MSSQPQAVEATTTTSSPAPLTSREEALARNHAAVIDRLQREGIPVPPPPAHAQHSKPA